MRKKAILIFIIILGTYFVWRAFFISENFYSSADKNTFWEVQCIDTMKYSRDRAREFLAQPDFGRASIRGDVVEIKSLGANCVAIGTPYDEEFIPLLKVWSEEIHNAGLFVWYRGNFSGFEGWFNYPKFISASEHHIKLREFILKNGHFFNDGDILTPAPEPENGLKNTTLLNDFIIASAKTCKDSFTEIARNVRCGYFGMNGDVARTTVSTEALREAGGVVVVDHYIRDPRRMGEDLQALHELHKFPVLLGEFGAPVPDLHGGLTDEDQARVVRVLLEEVFEQGESVIGLNYWVLKGGSTSLLDSRGLEKPAAEILRSFYKPALISGRATKELGGRVEAVTVTFGELTRTIPTDEHGNFSLLVPAGNVTLTASQSGFVTNSVELHLLPGEGKQITLELIPNNPSMWYRIQRYLRK